MPLMTPPETRTYFILADLNNCQNLGAPLAKLPGGKRKKSKIELVVDGFVLAPRDDSASHTNPKPEALLCGIGDGGDSSVFVFYLLVKVCRSGR